MSDPLSRLQAMLIRAEYAPEGPARLALVQSAVRLADAELDLFWQYTTRMTLMNTAFTTGDDHVVLATLPWCLATYDKHHAEHPFELHTLLWYAKHGPTFLSGFPSVSRQQIDETFQDVVRRYERHGAGLRAVYLHCMLTYQWLGDRERSTALRALGQLAARDEYSECSEWELFFEVDYLRGMRRNDEALAAGEPMLTGQQSAAEVFGWMAHLLWLPLYYAGKIEAARDYQRRAYPLISRNKRYLLLCSGQFAFLALVRDFSTALQLFERHYPWRCEARIPADHFSFDLRSWFLFARLAASGVAQVSLRLPAKSPYYRDDHRYATAALAEQFGRSAHDLESRFNARNGNGFLTELVDEWRALIAAP